MDIIFFCFCSNVMLAQWALSSSASETIDDMNISINLGHDNGPGRPDSYYESGKDHSDDGDTNRMYNTGDGNGILNKLNFNDNGVDTVSDGNGIINKDNGVSNTGKLKESHLESSRRGGRYLSGKNNYGNGDRNRRSTVGDENGVFNKVNFNDNGADTAEDSNEIVNKESSRRGGRYLSGKNNYGNGDRNRRSTVGDENGVFNKVNFNDNGADTAADGNGVVNKGKLKESHLESSRRGGRYLSGKNNSGNEDRNRRYNTGDDNGVLNKVNFNDNGADTAADGNGVVNKGNLKESHSESSRRGVRYLSGKINSGNADRNRRYNAGDGNGVLNKVNFNDNGADTAADGNGIVNKGKPSIYYGPGRKPPSYYGPGRISPSYYGPNLGPKPPPYYGSGPGKTPPFYHGPELKLPKSRSTNAVHPQIYNRGFNHYEIQSLEATNKRRQMENGGLRDLVLDEMLCNEVKRYARELANSNNCLVHGRWESDEAENLHESNFRRSPDYIIQLWYKTRNECPQRVQATDCNIHYKNLVEPTFTKMCQTSSNTNNGRYWCTVARYN